MIKIIINGRFLTQQKTGVQRYAIEFTRALDKILETRNDLKVQIISPPIPKKNKQHCDFPFYKNIIINEIGWFSGPPWEQIILPWFIKDSILLCLANTAPIISLWQGKNISVTVHSLSYQIFPNSYSFIFKLLYRIVIPQVFRFSRTLITISNHEFQKIKKLHPYVNKRFFAIQNGSIDSDQIHKEKKINNNEHKILYVGSLNPLKNVQRILFVAIELAKRRKFIFTFVGGISGGIRKINFKIPEDLLSYIRFIGWAKNDQELIDYYQSSSCLLFPSLYESSPFPPTEAMACGCPVIASNIPSLQERCGNAAIYCDPYNINNMIKTVEYLIDNPKLQNTLRKNGYKRARKYSWKNCVSKSLCKILE